MGGVSGSRLRPEVEGGADRWGCRSHLSARGESEGDKADLLEREGTKAGWEGRREEGGRPEGKETWAGVGPRERRRI